MYISVSSYLSLAPSVSRVFMSECVWVGVCVRACVCACVRACVRVCDRDIYSVCVGVYICRCV